MSENNKTINFAVIFRLYFKVIVKLFWFDDDFEIESKYHRKICCLVVLAHILSSQDVVFRSMFFLISEKLHQTDLRKGGGGIVWEGDYCPRIPPKSEDSKVYSPFVLNTRGRLYQRRLA